MKKISLKNMENALSRNEMRTIMAGSGGSPGWCGGFTWACARLGLYARLGNPNYCCSSTGSGGSW